MAANNTPNFHLKSYQTKTGNKGTTIILEDGLSQAIFLTRNWLEKQDVKPPNWTYHYNWDQEYYLNQLQDCIEEITSGNPVFEKVVQGKIDEYMGIIDDIYPIFSLNKQGYKRSADEGTHCSPELLADGEEACLFTPKHSAKKHFQKLPSGEGAYRILINTDVWMLGQPDENCALVSCIILLLQRYAPVEVWIQQGWLGSNKDDGVTLFRLDFTAGLNISNLAFWIASSKKDNPFSLLVNRALGRHHTGTSQYSEIESDIMVRGDWFSMFGLEEKQISEMLYTERIDLLTKYIAATSYKIIYGDNENDDGYRDIFGELPPTITE